MKIAVRVVLCVMALAVLMAASMTFGAVAGIGMAVFQRVLMWGLVL